jgi:hypothetical protein
MPRENNRSVELGFWKFDLRVFGCWLGGLLAASVI